MGDYFMMVLLKGKKRKVVARFNPQSGFGGLKWGEFIGTQRGKELLKLLSNLYCPTHHVWYIVSDHGYSNIPGIYDGEVIYRKSFDKHVGDFALHPDIRAESLKQSWTTSEMLTFQDKIRNDLNMHLDNPCTHVPHMNVRSLRHRSVMYVT